MFGFGKRRKGTTSRAGKAAGEANTKSPSPDLVTNLMLADIVLRGGGGLMRQGVERALLGRAYSPDTAKDVLSARSLRQSLVGAALARVATRSVPGAIVVGGGMLAKALYDRHRGQKPAPAPGKAKIAQAAKRAK